MQQVLLRLEQLSPSQHHLQANHRGWHTGRPSNNPGTLVPRGEVNVLLAQVPGGKLGGQSSV